MYTMPYMRELGSYLGQTSLLRKDFKIVVGVLKAMLSYLCLKNVLETMQPIKVNGSAL